MYTIQTMQRYLGISEVAQRARLSRNTVKSYSQIPGRLPEPDAVIGRIKGWLPETIDAWLAQRGS
jgi:predicted DNA-binding transcriptional regulator AlpA